VSLKRRALEETMSDHSKIEWTDATWNPVRGCTKVSPGCAHCYAETFAERFRGVAGSPFEQGFDLRLVPEKLGEPFRFAQPKRIFVNSMSDLFHVGVSDDYIERVARVMAASPWHTYQVLTKRSERLRDLLRGRLRFAAELEHIWWGVSVDDRRFGLPRVEHLRESGAAMPFLSVEPLLENLGPVEFGGLAWVIVGGESGPGARPMPAEWVRPLRNHCVQRGVPFFFKQWGGVRKHTTGRVLDGVTWDQFPVRQPAPVPPLVERRTMALKHSLPLSEGEVPGHGFNPAS
jgi:protein gp37